MLDNKTAMISGQIKPNQVNDPRIIEAFESVPRDAFVPKAMREIAYLDEDLEIAPGRFLIEPMALARLINAAQIENDEAVLDLACGTGYSTALLSRLASVVVGVEENDTFVDQATDALGKLEIDNGAVIKGAPSEGCVKQGLFQVIMIAGGAEQIPEALFEQLADGGRLVTVMVRDGVGRATVFTKTGGTISERQVFDSQVPVVPGFEAPKGFTF